MARPPSSGPKALRLIESIAADLVRRGEAELPGARTLARLASVSQTTMLTALRTMANRGILQRQGRHRYRLTDAYLQGDAVLAERTTQRPPVTGPKWRRLASRILEDIRAGSLTDTDGRLPTRKELMARYGVCYQTVARALEHLCTRGDLVQDRRSLRMPPVRGSGSRTRVVLIVRGYEGALSGPQVTLFDSRTLEWLRLTEGACARAGVTLEVHPCYYLTPQEVGVSGLPMAEFARSMAADETVLGYLAWSHSLSTAMLTHVLPPLVSHGRPIAVFDQPDQSGVPRIPGGERLLRAFAPSPSHRCGYEVGRYLYELGHRTIAYVSLAHAHRWSFDRLAGLAEAVCAGGRNGHVVELTASLAEPRIHRLGIRGVEEMLTAVNVRGPRVYQEFYGDLGEAMRQNAYTLYTTIGREEEHRGLSPLLPGLMTSHAPTAIVGANDDAALMCLRYLRDSGVSVPAEVSVLGFDDLALSSLNGMTSYSLNAPAIVNAMVAHLVKPDYRPRRRVVIDGFLAQRGSVQKRQRAAPVR